MKKKKKRIHEYTIEDDMKYRGPLSETTFRAAGWVCIALMQIAVILMMSIKIYREQAETLTKYSIAISSVASLALPLLLLANFARILNKSQSYKRQILLNLGFASGITFISILVLYRYMAGTAGALLEKPGDGIPFIQQLIVAITKKGFFEYNIFIDLLLCTLVMFFLDYRPKKFFVGKKLIYFRLLTILPILYEMSSLQLKWFAAKGTITLPLFTYPLLTVKPPMTFIVFIVLALFVKIREVKFLKNGKTLADYEAFLGTNRNSFQFSVFTAIVLAIAGLIDILAMFGFSIAEALSITIESGATSAAEIEASLMAFIPTAKSIGVGDAAALLLLAPFMLLFSYTRTAKNPMIDSIIPVVAMGLILIIYLEGIYQVASHLPLLQKVMETTPQISPEALLQLL